VLSLMVVDVATGAAKDVWHATQEDAPFTNITNIQWAGNSVVFPVTIPNDEFERYYSLSLAGKRKACATDDDRRVDRRRDGRRALEGRQHVLLLHERRRYRSAPHLGRTGDGRHAAADHDRRRHRECTRGPVVRRPDCRDERRREAADGHRRVAGEGGASPPRRRK
jgi:hypothetical protein